MKNPVISQVWPTPTPIPLPEATSVLADVLGDLPRDAAESVVQGWQNANTSGVIELLMLGFLLMLIFGGIWSIIKHLQRI